LPIPKTVRVVHYLSPPGLTGSRNSNYHGSMSDNLYPSQSLTCYFSSLDVYSLQCDRAVACLSTFDQVCRTTTRPQVRIYYGGGDDLTPVVALGLQTTYCNSDGQPKNRQIPGHEISCHHMVVIQLTVDCGEFRKHRYLRSPTYSRLITDLSRPSKRIFSPSHVGAPHFFPNTPSGCICLCLILHVVHAPLLWVHPSRISVLYCRVPEPSSGRVAAPQGRSEGS